MPSDKTYTRLIITVSVVVPALVVFIFYNPVFSVDYDLSFMPAIHAGLNGMTAIALTIGYIFIRNGKIPYHRFCMITALTLSLTFLLSYVFYHASTDPSVYGGTGWVRPVYFSILISHIILAAGVLPFILFTAFRALTADFQRHKKIARWTLPVWLYVAVTGVVVYVMNAEYYK